ncbi:hypothetical protein VTO42DRAFT_8620 [Malbranchea cinnamomea]
MATSRAGILKDLLRYGKYSDFTLTCGGRVFHVHRAVVCPQSPFFEAAVNGNFAEAHSKNVTLHEDPETIERMLSFMYNRGYDQAGRQPHAEDGDDLTSNDGDSGAREPSDSLRIAYKLALNDNPPPENPNTIPIIAENNLKVYIAAEKFGVTALKEMALRRLISWAHEHYESEAFPEVLRNILTTVPPHDHDLRDALVLFIVKVIDDIMGDDLLQVLTECDAISDVLKQVVADRAHQREEFTSRQIKLEDHAKCKSSWGHLTYSVEYDKWECKACEWST